MLLPVIRHQFCLIKVLLDRGRHGFADSFSGGFRSLVNQANPFGMGSLLVAFAVIRQCVAIKCSSSLSCSLFDLDYSVLVLLIDMVCMYDYGA